MHLETVSERGWRASPGAPGPGELRRQVGGPAVPEAARLVGDKRVSLVVVCASAGRAAGLCGVPV